VKDAWTTLQGCGRDGQGKRTDEGIMLVYILATARDYSGNESVGVVALRWGTGFARRFDLI
jgi:hypothetical protein